MKKGKPTIPREPAATTEQNKPVPSMRGALVLIFITLALLLAIYILSLLSSGTSNPYILPNQPPQEQNWTLSPLINQYHVTKVPTLVINCKYKFEGSDVDIGKALCTATNQSIFCNRFGGTAATLTNLPECRNGSKNIIYAFHSPSCPFSSAQRNSLDSLIFEFSSQLDIQYICTPKKDTATQDINYSCPQEFAAGRYNK